MERDELLFYYQQELAFIRRLGAEFAAAHPKIAGRLRLDPKTVEDPHVARLIEAFALANARIRHKLDDEFPEISDALLEVLHPHALAPIPALSLVQFHGDASRLARKETIPAGTALVAEAITEQACHFTTCYPAQLLPVVVKQACLTGKPLVAPLIPAMDKATAILRLSLGCTSSKLTFAELDIDYLRFFLNAPTQYAYALYELLFKHTIGIALADSPRDANPIVLSKSCLQPVGFKEEEGMLPYNQRTFMGYRLLTEFFAFPEKFLFFDLIQLTSGITQKFTTPGSSLEIYFYLDRLNPLLEKNLNPHFFALSCTPIVNLFEKKAEPIALTHTQTEYHLIPDADRPPEATEVYAVKRVIATTEDGKEMEYHPFYGIKHHQETTYYHLARKPAWTGEHYLTRGTEVFLGFVNTNFESTAQATWIVTTDIYCTNRNLPEQLPFGGNQPHLTLEEKIESVSSIRCLIPMTPTRRPALRQGARWRYVSHLALNHLSLTNDSEGINALQNILKLYTFDQAAEHQHLLEGLLNISSRHITARNPNDYRGNVFWQGTEITLLVDETKFTDTSLYLLSCILDHFFALYATINSFTQLIITTRHQGEIHRFTPRVGNKLLV